MPGRIRPGRFSSRNLNQKPKWMSVSPPKITFTTHSTLSSNPFHELSETEDYSLRYIKLNAYNTVFTASKNAIEFISSTTDTNSDDERTKNHSMKKLPSASPIFPLKELTSQKKLITLCNKSQRERTSKLYKINSTLAPPIFPLKEFTSQTTKLITLCNKS